MTAGGMFKFVFSGILAFLLIAYSGKAITIILRFGPCESSRILSAGYRAEMSTRGFGERCPGKTGQHFRCRCGDLW